MKYLAGLITCAIFFSIHSFGPGRINISPIQNHSESNITVVNTENDKTMTVGSKQYPTVTDIFIPHCDTGKKLVITTQLGTLELCDAYWGTSIVTGNTNMLGSIWGRNVIAPDLSGAFDERTFERTRAKVSDGSISGIAQGTSIIELDRGRIYYILVNHSGKVHLIETLPYSGFPGGTPYMDWHKLAGS